MNGAFVSLIDKGSGHEFLWDADAPKTLFRLAIRRGQSVEWFDSREAGEFRWEKEERTDGSTLSLEASSFPKYPVAVKISVNLDDGSALSIWRMSVSGVPKDMTVEQLTCPIISGAMKVGHPLPGESVAVPRDGEGYLFTNPYPVVDRLPLMAGDGPESPHIGMGEVHGRYPGRYSIQLMLYYNDYAGLYLACHDWKQNVKTFDLGRMADWGMVPVMSISHIPSQGLGEDVSFEYDTHIGVFSGDWYDGTDIYKEWARKQWWCQKKLIDKDISNLVRKGFGVFQMSNYDMPVVEMTHPLSRIADTVNSLSKESGVPILALIFNFEKGGAWSGPIGFFPMLEGDEEFKRAMKKLRDWGNAGFVYIPGGNWYIALDSYTPPFDSWKEFEADGRPNACMEVDGTVRTRGFYEGWHSARICPGTAFTQKMSDDLVLGCLERDCDVVQIDNFPISSAAACYNPKHGHPLGTGRWWSEAWNKILEGTRRKAKELNPECILTSEGISENFIPYFDMFDHRAGNMEYFGHYRPGDPMGGEAIPIFNYVYNEYIGSYCAAYPECTRPEVLYWARCYGKSLAQGVVPTGGWYLREAKELNPVSTGFYKKVVRADAQECWKYLMFGEMLKPPKIDVPRITFSYVRFLDLIQMPVAHPERRHTIEDYAIQHSAWRAPDGTIGYFFINVSEAPVEFTVDLSLHSAGSESYTVDCVADGRRERILEKSTLPRNYRLRMEPLSVVLVEILAPQ
jgi:hypothetical protein